MIQCYMENDEDIPTTYLTDSSRTCSMTSVSSITPATGNMTAIADDTIIDVSAAAATIAKSSEFIDNMTLELLMNRNHFKKYMSKSDPEKLAEIEEFHLNIQKYREQIIDITEDQLNHPDKQITTDVNESFENYMKTLIKYFQMKKVESENKYNAWNQDESKDDDDTMFSNMDEMPPTRSFWGKERVLKKSGAMYDIRMFSNNKTKLGRK